MHRQPDSLQLHPKNQRLTQMRAKRAFCAQEPAASLELIVLGLLVVTFAVLAVPLIGKASGTANQPNELVVVDGANPPQ